MKKLNFEIIEEAMPGEKFSQLFKKNWPAYRTWYLDEGEAARATYLECITALKKYMPELYPLYQQMLDLLNCDDLQARFLSLYRPPPFYSGCSQLICKKDKKALIRNYDFPPILCEGTVIHSRWLDKGVIAMADCGWGALDGMNDSGLTISIAYGGRLLQGDGFGITIIIRYILETCSTVEEAIIALKRTPVHLDYNIALLDKTGQHATLFIAPDQDVRVTQLATSTNHYGSPDTEIVLFLDDSMKRLDALNALLCPIDQTLSDTISQFLIPPLYRPHHIYQSGTLYTAVYYPEDGKVNYLWPHQSLILSFSQFIEQKVQINYDMYEHNLSLPKLEH